LRSEQDNELAGLNSQAYAVKNGETISVAFECAGNLGEINCGASDAIGPGVSNDHLIASRDAVCVLLDLFISYK
jgi:hypothetical protein